MECELDWVIAVGMKGSCRISYTWIPPVKTQPGPLTWVAFMATACMIHTNHISGSAVWTKRSRYVMSCKWEGRGSVVWYGYKHLTLPTDAWLIEFLLFSLLLDLFGCIYVGECVDGARSRVRACVAGVAWGKMMGACSGSAGCPPSKIIQSLSSLLACDYVHLNGVHMPADATRNQLQTKLSCSYT